MYVIVMTQEENNLKGMRAIMNHQLHINSAIALLSNIFSSNAVFREDGFIALIPEVDREAMIEVVNTLRDEQKSLILYRFGFVDGYYHSQESTAEKFGIPMCEEKRIEALAMRTLRHPSRSRQLKKFIFASESDWETKCNKESGIES